MIFVCFFVADTKVQPQLKELKSDKVSLVEKNKPSVYIEFEKFGKTQPLFENESNERLWLKLHNNSVWEISFCSFSVGKSYGDIGIVHEVKKVSIPIGRVGRGITPDLRNNMNQEEKTPKGYSAGDTCSPFSLASGQSVSFSIPKNHISEKFFIDIEFWYDWENRYNELGTFPHSFVSFENSRLP